MCADRSEVQKGSAETFFRKVKFWKEDGEGDTPPVFVGTLFMVINDDHHLVLFQISFHVFFFPFLYE